MGFIKGLFTIVGFIVVVGGAIAFIKFDGMTRISQIQKLDDNALPEYMKMFDKVLTTGDAARAMIRRVKVDADVVIFALGFNVGASEFLSKNKIATNEWGEIIVNERFQTNKKSIYAGGDCQRGADLAVRAASDGKIAAKSIMEELGINKE